LEVQTRLGWSLHFLGAPGQIETFCRARDLAEEVGTERELFWPLMGLFVVTHWAGDHRWGKELAEPCLSLALKEGDPALLGPAHESVGRNAIFRGEFSKCRRHYEAILQLDYDPEKHPDPRYMLGWELSSIARGMLGWCLWKLGYPDQGLERCREAVAHAAKNNPIGLCYVQFYETFVHQFRRAVPATRASLSKSRRAAADKGLAPLWEGPALVTEGWCRAAEGDLEGGIECLRLGHADMKSKGLGVARAWALMVLADVFRAGGRAEEALVALEESAALSAASDEHLYESEQLRIKGESLLQLDVPRPEEAEPALREAMAVARRQEAKSFELRAATSLGRLLRDTGRPEEALGILREVYDWFTEGFDTADLKDASALLHQLESR